MIETADDLTRDFIQAHSAYKANKEITRNLPAQWRQPSIINFWKLLVNFSKYWQARSSNYINIMR